MHLPKQVVESIYIQISSRSGQVGWHLLKVGLLAAVTALSTWAGIRGNLFSGAATAAREPITLAMFGGVLVSLGLLLRRQPS